MSNIIIQDSERVAAEFPTFEIPPREERESLDCGDFAKLVFRSEPAPYEKPAAERMWVKVIERLADGNYRGKLDNTPVELKMTRGEDVVFGPEHIIQLIRE